GGFSIIPFDCVRSRQMASDFHFMASFCTLLNDRPVRASIEGSYDRRNVHGTLSLRKRPLLRSTQLPLLDK
ncbi:hypothetical protein ACSTIX_24040, partial [Vibrio parahaemolyticus]